MQKLATVQGDDFNQPKGIQRSRRLPDHALGTLWDSIILEERLKAQLLSQAMLNFTMRGKVDRSVIPLHGVILLVGPPGTGKTSLARGLAHRTAESFRGSGFRLLEIEPHALTSSAMGKTQRAVSELFSQSIAESASIVTSSLSRAQVEGVLAAASHGTPPTPHFVQLYWLLMSYFSACIEMGVRGYVVCRP